MKRVAFWLLGPLLALTPMVTAAKGWAAAEGEAKLAKLLDRRKPGKPVSCITTAYRIPNGLQVIDGVGVVYDAGDTIYVSRATNPERLRWTDRPMFDRSDPSRLCASDRIITRDRVLDVQTGVVFLKDFVPYTKVS